MKSEKRYVSKEDIIAEVNILEIAKEFSIELEGVASGNFNYRCRCPSKDHKNGNERTGSCYIDSRKNNFFCYGCNQGHNCIDFYMLCANLTFSEAIAELKGRVKVGSGKREDIFVVETNNFYTLLQVSNLFRRALLKHPEDAPWIEKLIKYSDQFILELDGKDEEGAKRLFRKIKDTIKSRYKRKE